MKAIFVLLIFILYSLYASSQYDTSLIRKALIYINSKEFKNDLKEFTDKDIRQEISTFPTNSKLNKRYKSSRLDHMKPWIKADCFNLTNSYFIPILQSRRQRKDDSLWFDKFDTLYRTSSSICNSGLTLEPFLLAPLIIEFRYFEG